MAGAGVLGRAVDGAVVVAASETGFVMVFAPVSRLVVGYRVVGRPGEAVPADDSSVEMVGSEVKADPSSYEIELSG